MPPRLPDLALDSLLYTQTSDFITSHSSPDVDQIGRRTYRTEQWRHERYLGSRGQIRLERCMTPGSKQNILRAVRIIKESRQQGVLDFSRELEAIAKFSNDRYRRWFVKSYGWFEETGSISITMEYCVHGNLQYYLSTRRSLPVSEARQLTTQILEGLDRMHEHDFAHTDLRPKNILIKSMPPNEDWWVVLTDFGISKHADPNELQPVDNYYLAPELLQTDCSYTSQTAYEAKAADMWALGTITIQMLTGEAAVKGTLDLTDCCAGQTFPLDRLTLSITSDTKDFISHLMTVYPTYRSNTRQALEHPWISSREPDLTGRLSELDIRERNPLAYSPSPSAPLEPIALDAFASPPRGLHLQEDYGSKTIPQTAAQQHPASSTSYHQVRSADFEERRVYANLLSSGEDKEVCHTPIEPMKNITRRHRSTTHVERQRLMRTSAENVDNKEVCTENPTKIERDQVILSIDLQEDRKVRPIAYDQQESDALPNQVGIQLTLPPLETSFVEKTAFRTLVGHSRAVNSIAFSPDGKMIVSAADDGTVRVWDGELGAELEKFQGHQRSAKAVVFSPIGGVVVSASSALGGTIRRWDVSSWEQQKTFKCNTHAVNTLAYASDGTLIASASLLDQGPIKFWDSKSGKLERTLHGHWLSVNSMSFSPDNKTFASASHDGSIRLWDPKEGKLMKTFEGYSQWVNAIALEPTGIRAKSFGGGGIPGGIRHVSYSRDSQLLASASDDGTVKLWDSRSGSMIKALKRNWRWSTVSPVGINAVSFSLGDTSLASASDDGTIRMWDLRSDKLLQSIKAHTKWISSLTFSPDGITMASTSHDGTIRLWR